MDSRDETPVSKWNTAPAYGVAWLRTGLTLLILGGSAWMFIQGTHTLRHGTVHGPVGNLVIWFLTVPLLIIGILSLVIAVALFCKSVRGITAALIFDVFCGGPVVLAVVVSSTNFFFYGNFGAGEMPSTLRTTAVAAGVVLLMGAEAAWLLSACRGWKDIWLSYTVLAVLMTAMVVWVPLAEYQGIRHVRVLREYIPEHLVNVPTNAQFRARRESLPNGGHRHSIEFSNPEYCWVFFAQHDDGGWRLEGLGGLIFLFGMNRNPTILSASEARNHLVRHGVPASNLGTNLEVKLPMKEEYVIDAPVIGGRYGVTTNGRVRLYFPTPQIISDSHQEDTREVTHESK